MVHSEIFVVRKNVLDIAFVVFDLELERHWILGDIIAMHLIEFCNTCMAAFDSSFPSEAIPPWHSFLSVLLP